jgi:hypothetical protein
MGWHIVKVYKDHGISGAARRDKRPAFDALCRDAAKRQFDTVMAWSVDRLGRSLQDLIGFLSELHALRIDLFLHQQGLDTTTPAGKGPVPDAGCICRVRAGNHSGTSPRRAGKGQERGQTARPTPDDLENAIRAALNKPGRTEGVRKIAARFGVDPSTVQRISRSFGGASVAAG